MYKDSKRKHIPKKRPGYKGTSKKWRTKRRSPIVPKKWKKNDADNKASDAIGEDGVDVDKGI